MKYLLNSDGILGILCSPYNCSAHLIASRKYYDGKNHAKNAVYTVLNGGYYEPGQAVTVDLNMFAAYTVQGQLADDKEHLLAYEDVKLDGDAYAENNIFEITLANNNIDYIINRLDDIVQDEQTIDTLIALASAKV